MRPLLLEHRLVAALAGCALLFAALAPPLSHALVAARAVPPLEAMVCTADGARRGTPPADAPRTPKAHPLEHCPFCASHAVPLAPPPAQVAMPATPGVDPLPALDWQAPPALLARTAAQPRAPPFAS